MALMIPTLQEVCVNETAELLKRSYWNTNFPFGYNPFTLLPSAIVDALIVHVTELSRQRALSLESSDLQLLLTSNRVREFVLEDIHVNAESLQEIFLDLSTACEKLVKIQIRNVFCNIINRMNLHMKTHTLNCLLQKAKNVKHVESCIEFNVEVLSNARHLEKLILNFPVKNHIFDFLEVGGQLVPSRSLKYLEIYEDAQNRISYLDIAVILRYCTELIHINCDISKSLEYLHSEQLYNGSVSDIYSLKECNLGSMNDRAATRDGVYLASLTCPYLTNVNLLADDDQTIYALSDFHNLKTLLIQWEKLQFGDYSCGIQLLLEKPNIGQNLISLDIINFTNIDLSSIGKCCPNLESLRVEFEYEINQNEFLPTSFQKLQLLALITDSDSDNIFGCREDTLLGILPNTTNLKSLSIIPTLGLTDVVLRAILKKNCLSKLKDLRFSNCSLSNEGIRDLFSNLTDLEFFDAGETDHFDDIAAIIHEINPKVFIASSTS